MKQKLLLFATALFLSVLSYAQVTTGVAINATGADAAASAILDVSSITKGALVPRMTAVQRGAIVSPATGLLVFQTDAPEGFYYYNTASSWVYLTNSAGVLAIANGGTGSSSQNFVDLTTDQTVAGNKILSGNTTLGGTLGVTGVATLTAAPVLSSTTASQALFTNAGKNVVSNPVTGTGNVVMSTSPTLVTPTLGVASATSINGLTPASQTTGFTIAGGTTPKTLTVPLDASVSGTNTGDNAVNSLYSGVVTNATHTGDAEGATALTVKKINGVALSGLASGILKNTTATGVPSVAVDGTDYLSPTTGWSLTGNSGTTAGTNFIGTTDDKALVFKVNSQKAGLVSTGTNTSFGYQTLNVNIGVYNTSNGYQALLSNTSGNGNTAIGSQALYSNITGYNNTANGYNALYSNISHNNTANGASALYSNTSGHNNTANGASALYLNISGQYNTANGYHAGTYITGGAAPNATSSNSVYLGAQTKAFADAQTNEIVIGYNAIGAGSNTVTLGNTSITSTVLRGNVQHYGTTSGYVGLQSPATVATPYSLTLPTAAPASDGQVLSATTAGVMSWASAGSGWGLTGNIVTATDFIGTTNDQPLVFKVNSQNAGLVSSGTNTSFGYQTLNAITSGTNNTANGYKALWSNTQGSYNNANGYQALYSNTLGVENNAYGYQALYSNTMGGYNTANGSAALKSNTTGESNTANGYMALCYTIAGNNNTANGNRAGSFISGGSSENATSNTSVFLGALTKALAHSQSNEIVIGYDATGAGSNTATLGNTSITSTVLRGDVSAKRYVLTQPSAIAAAGTTTIDLSLGNVFQVNLGANIGTLTLTNPAVGTYLVKFTQDGAGSRTVAFPAGWYWSGGTAPTVTATAAKTDIVTLIWDGTSYYATIVQNF
ncbi:MAG: hypothetical protein WCJ26_01415 [bacterium]